jgi:hypothetical protein
MRAPLVRDALDAVYLGNPLRAWLVAAAVLAGAFAALVLARRLALRRLGRAAPRTATEADDLALSAVRDTSALFLFAVALAAARKALLDLPQDVKDTVTLVARLAFYLQAARWGWAAVAFWVGAHVAPARRDRQGEPRHPRPARCGRAGAIAVVLVLLALEAFGVNITALVTGLGIAGVAVALGRAERPRRPARVAVDRARQAVRRRRHDHLRHVRRARSRAWG